MTKHSGTFITGVVFIIFGTAALGESVGWWDVDIGRLWPLILVAIGVSMILSASRRDRDRSDETSRQRDE